MHVLWLTLIIVSCTTLYSDQEIQLAALPHPYCDLQKLLPSNVHGWIVPKQLDSLLRKPTTKVVVELGSWTGKSTIYMAERLPTGSRLYAVDHWQGLPRHIPMGLGHFLPLLYEQFLSNVIHAGVAQKVIPLKMTTLEAAAIFTDSIDILYVDAAHDEESVYRDLVAWSAHVRQGGCICGDDWNWHENNRDTVANAVRRFAQERNFEIKVDGVFWRLHAASNDPLALAD